MRDVWILKISKKIPTEKVKGQDMYILPLTKKPEQQQFIVRNCVLTYWLALAVGSAAQLGATHCPNKWTLDPQSPTRQTHMHCIQKEGW